MPGKRSVADLTAGPDRAAGRGGRPRRRARDGSRSPRAAGRRLHGQRQLARPAHRGHPGRSSSRCTSATRTSPDGITLHWHGVDVPNAEDGVAGVTQDAVDARRGATPTASSPTHAGTYWYHSHQVSHEQVRGGLLGAARGPPAPAATRASSTSWRWRTPTTAPRPSTAAGRSSAVDASRASASGCGSINTDNGPVRVWADRALPRCVAVDGRDVHGPTAVDGTGRRRDRRRAGRPRGDRARPTGPPSASRSAARPRCVVGPTAPERRRAPSRPRRASTCCTTARPAPLGLRPGAAPTGLRLLDRPPARLRRRDGPGCGGRSTATCSRTCRCSWSARATSS